MKAFRNTRYQIISSDEASATRNSNKEETGSSFFDVRRNWILMGHRASRLTLALGVALLIILPTVSFAFGCWVTKRHTQKSGIQECLSLVDSHCKSPYLLARLLGSTNFKQAPANEAVSYYEVDFANAFDQKSQYRGPPTLELEMAWKNLWDRESCNPNFYNISLHSTD